MAEFIDVHLAETLEALPLDVLALAVALAELVGDGLSLFVGVHPVDLIADLGGVERWLGGVHVARFEHRLHVLVDQGEQQTTDVAAVDIGITQDHDAAITAVVEVEVAAGTSADGREQGLGLGIVEDLLLAGLGRIDHLAPQRQDRHGLGVAPSLGRTGGGVALDQDDLGVGAVRATVGQLLGHAGRAELRGLALVLEDLLGRHPVLNRSGELVGDRLDMAAWTPARLEPLLELLVGDATHDRLDRWRTELLLGLTTELRFGEGDLDGGDETFLDVVLDRLVLVFLLELRQLAVVLQDDIVDRLRERLVEAGLMGAALTRGDRVDEGDDLGVVATRPPQGDIDTALALDVGHLAVDRDLLGEGVDAAARDDLIDRGTGRQVLDEIGEPTAAHERERLAEPGALTRP